MTNTSFRNRSRLFFAKCVVGLLALSLSYAVITIAASALLR